MMRGWCSFHTFSHSSAACWLHPAACLVPVIGRQWIRDNLRMRHRGFTLIELLVTFAIVAVLAAMAMPSMTTFFGRRSVQSAATTFADDMRFARAEAVKRAQSVTVCRSSDGATCAASGQSWSSGWIVFTDYDSDAVVDAGEVVLRSQGALTGIARLGWMPATGTPASLTYRATGISVLASGTWEVAPSGSIPARGTQAVVISNQGRVKVCPIGAGSC